MNEELIKKHSLIDLCMQAENARAEVRSAREAIDSAEKFIKEALASEYTTLPRFEDEKALGEIDKVFWRHLIKTTRVDAILSDKKLTEFEQSLDVRNGHMPPVFDYKTASSTLNGLKSNAHELMNESIIEAYKILRPYYSTRKSNQKAHIGELCNRAILSNMVEPNYSGGLRLSYYRTKEVNLIEKAFSLLEGKGCRRYPDDLQTEIAEHLKGGESVFDTHYFKVKCFKGGTMHMIFKRMDLVKKMEQIASSNTLTERGAA